jgi:hypothetical protein
MRAALGGIVQGWKMDFVLWFVCCNNLAKHSSDILMINPVASNEHLLISLINTSHASQSVFKNKQQSNPLIAKQTSNCTI